MSSADDKLGRFERLKAHLEAIVSWAEVQRDDLSLVVDTGELDSTCEEYRGEVEKLLAIPPTPENRDRLSKQIANVWATAHSIRMTSSDPEGSLDRLMASICGDDDEDEGEVNGRVHR